MQQINSVQDLQAFAKEKGLRKDWHEPDEQDISAYAVGDHLDNAMGSGIEHNHGELNVVLTYRGNSVAVVNLATLLSWATESAELEYQLKSTQGLLKNARTKLERIQAELEPVQTSGLFEGTR